MESDFSKCVPALGAIKRGDLVKNKSKSARLAGGAASWAVAGRFRGRVCRVKRGPESYGRGHQGDGRGQVKDGMGHQEGHWDKDGMVQEKEDGMDGEMALHSIPTMMGDTTCCHKHLS